jgi:hypothetical protein
MCHQGGYVCDGKLGLTGALTLVIALVKETLPVSMKGNGPGLLGTQVKPAGHCATSVTIADSSITVRLGVVGKLKSALGDGPNGSPRCPEWLVMVTRTSFLRTRLGNIGPEVVIS